MFTPRPKLQIQVVSHFGNLINHLDLYYFRFYLTRKSWCWYRWFCNAEYRWWQWRSNRWQWTVWPVRVLVHQTRTRQAVWFESRAFRWYDLDKLIQLGRTWFNSDWRGIFVHGGWRGRQNLCIAESQIVPSQELRGDWDAFPSKNEGFRRNGLEINRRLEWFERKWWHARLIGNH